MEVLAGAVLIIGLTAIWGMFVRGLMHHYDECFEED